MASKEERQKNASSGEAEGARRATGASPDGGLKKGQRWSLKRKQEVVLRILRGESLDALSREFGLEIYRLEEWRERALVGMEEGLRERFSQDPAVVERDAALKRVGELSMEVELLRARPEGRRPLSPRRSKR